MAAPLIHKIAQANFIKTIGAVLPNARIDFQSGLNTPPPPPDTPPPETPDLTALKDGRTEILTASCDAVTSVISDCSTGRTSESMIGQSAQRQVEPHETRTPSTGTPEWTPRATCAERPPQVSYDGDDLACQFMQPIQLPYYLPSQQEIPIPEASSVGPDLAPPEHALQGTQTWDQPMWYGDVAAQSWYRVAYLGGIEVRVQPSFLAARSGVVLPQNEVFPVSAEIVGADGRIYLRLADGRGWAFDDSALLPHDPSVVRGHFAPTEGVNMTIPPYTPAVPLQPTSSLQHHVVGSEDAQEMASYSYPVPGPPLASACCSYPGPTSVQTHIGSAAHPAATSCSYMGTMLQLEPASSLQADATATLAGRTWGEVAPDTCTSWSSLVTSDCPPTWEPSIGPPVAAASWEPRHWTQYS